MMCIVVFLTFFSLAVQSTQLAEEATVLFEKQECEGALLKYEELVKIYKSSNDQFALARAFYNMGICYNNTWKSDKAIDVLKKAEAIHRQNQDTNSVGLVLIELARTEALKSNFKESHSIALRALEIHEKNGNQKGIADSLRLITVALQVFGEAEKSLSFAERALTISTEIGDKVGIGKSLRDIGLVYFNRGNLPEALKLFEQARKAAEASKDKKTLCDVLRNTAMLYGEQGDYQRELKTYEIALEIAKETNDLRGQAAILMNSGSVEYGLGNFGKASQLLLEALTISEKIGNKRYVAGSLSNLAGIHFYSGNDETALDYLQKSMKVFEEIGDNVALSVIVGNFGAYYYEQEEFDKALKYFQKSLQIRKENKDTEGIIWSLNYLGDVHEKLKKYDQAMKYYTEAHSLAQTTGFKSLTGLSHLGMGVVHYHKKQLSLAESSIETALEIASSMSDWTTLWLALRIQAKIFSDTSRKAEALASIKESVSLIESVRAGIDLAEQKAGYFESKREAYEELIGMLLEENNIEEAFQYAQRSKARAFLDMLAEAEIDPIKNLDPALVTKRGNLLKDLAEVQSEIRKLTESDPPNVSKVNELSKRRIELDGQYSNLQMEIRKQNPRYADLQYPNPTLLNEAQASLDDQTILLEYFVGESHSYLFAVTNQGSRGYILPEEKKLSAQILQIREFLQKPTVPPGSDGPGNFRTLASLLYSELVKPAEAELGEKEKIIIAPDGPLNYLPFEILVTNTSKKQMNNFSQLAYIATQHEIRYVPSVSVLKQLQQKPATQDQKQFIAFANPLLKKTTEKDPPILVRAWASDLGMLPHAKTEVEEIAKMYSKEDASILIGEDASEKNVKTLQLDHYKRIHFASHGLIDEEKPELSALVLSADEKQEEDGFLTMREVFDLNLNADLVVLSACQTGLGQQIRGEGVSGLSRAFLVAGTTSVLVSLWNVYDKTTADFMKEFYENMEQKKMSKTEALKQVRLDMIHNQKSSHPHYWAAFVLIGQ
jgi:CHAT domain-containing protein/Tfp pilus assembly protein PilF